MPKVTLIKENEYKKELAGTIKAKMAYMGVDREEASKVLGVCTKTLTNRYRTPELLTVEQLYKLCKKLKFEVVINDTGVHCRMERE